MPGISGEGRKGKGKISGYPAYIHSWGLRFMKDANYDPRAMIKVMEVLKAASKRGGIDIFQTHPNPDQRIKDIETHLQKNPPGAFNTGHLLRELYTNPSLID